MTVRTVGQLKAALSQYPDDMPIIGYDGSDRLCHVSVYDNDYHDVDGEKPPPSVVIDIS